VQLVGAYQLVGYAAVVVAAAVVIVVVVVVVVVGKNIKRNTKMPLNSAMVLLCK